MGQIRLKNSAVVGLCSPLGIALRAKKKFPALRKAETMIVSLESTRQGWDSCTVTADTFNARTKRSSGLRLCHSKAYLQSRVYYKIIITAN